MRGVRALVQNGPARGFVIGLLIAAGAAAIALGSPALVAPHANWFDGGIRLLRDDKEISFYFLHSLWIDGSLPVGKPLTQDYPPVGVLYFSLSRVLAKTFVGFETAFVHLNVLSYAALFALTASLLEGESLGQRRLAFFVLPAFLYFSLWRFDILPAVLVAAALLAAKRKSPEPAFVLLLVAALAKWYAALFFPPFLVYFALLGGGELPVKRLGDAMLWMAGFGVALTAATAHFAGLGALVEPVLFHLSRDIEEGSVSAVLLTCTRALGVDWRWLHALLLRVFFVAQFAAVIPVIWREYPNDFKRLVRCCVFLLIPFMALGAVFSAQWIVWLTPVLLLVADRTELKLLALLDVVVFLQFPVLFGINPYGVSYLLFTVLRTALLAALWWRSFRALSPVRTGAQRATG